MPKGFTGYEYLMVCTCEQTNFTITILLQQCKTEYIAKALVTQIIALFGPPKTLIVDGDCALTSQIIQATLQALKYDMKLISPYNHGSSKTE